MVGWVADLARGDQFMEEAGAAVGSARAALPVQPAAAAPAAMDIATAAAEGPANPFPAARDPAQDRGDYSSLANRFLAEIEQYLSTRSGRPEGFFSPVEDPDDQQYAEMRMLVEGVAAAGQAYFRRMEEVAQLNVRVAFDLMAPGEGGANKGALTTRLQHMANVMRVFHGTWPPPAPPPRRIAIKSSDPPPLLEGWTRLLPHPLPS